MKTILDQTTRDELIRRINSLNENNMAEWGKMTVGQMIRHCSQWDEMAQGKTAYKQSFLGKVVGKMALKDMLKDEPARKNLPTVPSFKITYNPDVVIEKEKWIKLMSDYEKLSDEGFMHPFFGHLTKEQTGYLVYKHADHHLRQFHA